MLVLTTRQLDRAAGALLGLAVGDALGAGYEFTTPDATTPIEMIGGGLGNFAPGEWTDDTAQAVGIAQVTATGRVDPLAIGQRFLDWFDGGPADVGISTRHVLLEAGAPDRLTAAAAAYFADHPEGAAGNGSLMRTSPVALAHLGDDEAIARAAMEVSALTHGDPLTGEACVVWCIAVDRAVREGRLDGAWDGTDLLPSDRANWWRERLREAEGRPLSSFSQNGFVVTALQAAHAAITQTPVPTDRPCRHLQHALRRAVRIGDDTDTVAAIAGQVLGARWGASAVPASWRLAVHGWPGLRADDLVRLAVLTARGGHDDEVGWPSASSLVPWSRSQEPTPVCVEVPGIPDLWAGNLPGLPVAVERGVEAVVSLCRVGRDDVPGDLAHLQVWLTDQASEQANPNLDFVVEDTAAHIERLLDDGRSVYVHCVGGHSRTPTVVAAAMARLLGIGGAEAMARLREVLPVQDHNDRFHALVSRLPDTVTD